MTYLQDMKYILTTALFFSFSICRAQVKISGTITDNKNKPLAGASIQLKDTYDGATSDLAGNYSFTTNEKGEKSVEVTISGYNPITQKVTLTSTPVVLQRFRLKL